jgi:hypothetical protein
MNRREILMRKAIGLLNTTTWVSNHIPILLAVFTGIIFALFYIKAYVAESWLIDHGERKAAIIIDKQSYANVASGDEEYTITYEFSVPGKTVFRKKINVDYAEWKGISTYDSAVIAFNPAKPSQNHPVALGVYGVGSTILTIVFSPVISLFAYLLFSFGEYLIQNQFFWNR